jgi:hypothetical protein
VQFSVLGATRRRCDFVMIFSPPPIGLFKQ